MASHGAPGAAVATLSAEDQAAAARIESYLNELTTLRARFVQVSSNGGFAEGVVHLSRPGKFRFDYDPPHPALLVANGITLLYYDRQLKQATFIPLWETPLWFLIREKVEIGDSIEIVGLERGLAAIRMTLREKESGDAGTVTLVFSDRPLVLRKWEITDAQGIVTQVALIDPQFGAQVDDEVFEYGDLDIHNLGRPRDP